MDYRQLAYQKALKYGLDPDLFLRQINQESGFNPKAVSSAGAIGLGQLMPNTARELGVDPTDPEQNLEGAARYMRQQMDRFGRTDLALAAYNAGPTRVAKANAIPNIAETQNYVSSILGSSPRISTKDATMTPTMATAAKQEEPKSLWDRLTGRSEVTGLNALEALASGLDALILPEMRMGGSIREQGAQRAKLAREEKQRNKSIEYLKSRADAGDDVAAKILGAVSTGNLPVGTGISTYLTQALATPKEQAPLTELAKIQADYAAGRLSKDQYETAVGVFANKNKMGIRTNPDGTIEFVQGSDLPKLTEAQSKDINWAARMTGALEAFEPVADVLTSPTDKLFGLDPTGLARHAQSGDYQKAEVAGLEFLAPLLRKDTGAAVTPKEWDFYSKIYIPTIGDQPEALAAKKAARSRALEALKLGIPPEYVTRVQTVGGDPIAEAVSEGIIEKDKVSQQTQPAQQAQPAGVPQVGTIEQGYRFKGGDPSDEANWEKVN